MAVMVTKQNVEQKKGREQIFESVRFPIHRMNLIISVIFSWLVSSLNLSIRKRF